MSKTEDFVEESIPAANQVMIEAPENESSIPSWMVTADEEVRATTREALAQKDLEWNYYPVHISDKNGIKDMQDRNCTLEANHPLVSEKNGIMVYREKREIADLRYKADSERMRARLKGIVDANAGQGEVNSDSTIGEMSFDDARSRQVATEEDFSADARNLAARFAELEEEQ